MDPRLPVAITAGKIIKKASQLLKTGGGTAAPGLVAETIHPKILGQLTQKIPLGSVLITGTNGKTTTSRLLSHVFEEAGVKSIHNRSGSNLTRGLTSTLISHAKINGSIPAQIGLFEIDEAALTQATEQITPKVLVINNLFRDQLDRYFELDQLLLRWRKVIKSLPAATVVCLNGDDPRLATLGKFVKGRVIYFGIKESKHQLQTLPQSADILSCPNCSALLTYEEIYLGHQGRYFCPNCQFKRPHLDVFSSGISLEGLEGVKFTLYTPTDHLPVELGVPGFYNIYNALAAAAAATALNIDLPHIKTGLEKFKAVFGRIERVKIGSKKLLITLVKNPTGFNEVLRLLTGTENEHLLLALNDLIADGRDVSWIWDVDVERLATQKQTVVASGLRAWDLANRLKYAGIDPKLLYVEPDLEKALKWGIKKTPPGETLYILPTYTAMLGLRQILTKMGHVGHFWED